MSLQIKWTKHAFVQFETAIDYIYKDSPQAAEKVRTTILQKIGSLVLHPEKYNLDKFKLMNDGSFRAFEIYHHRISYRLLKNEIRIIRIRHTKMNPKNF